MEQKERNRAFEAVPTLSSTFWDWEAWEMMAWIEEFQTGLGFLFSVSTKGLLIRGPSCSISDAIPKIVL